jgi:hypothetical protein
MLPPARPKHKDDMRKQALSSILAANSPTLEQKQQQEPNEEAVVEEEAEDDFSFASNGLQCPQRQSKQLPKLASWEQYWDERREVKLPDR